ncbi:cell wall hydrolase [Deefgea piscis]|uniref:Cell wall hydrolase n=1 Tax=Deefgea piscis TaxID=2739061 RepID=A0A6M8SSJ0_9NEIS|nr:cell wall hydrolase [Deefgea piscis]QKJ66296.1 cell wall hydrolase [Deefgea piscis]
MGIAVQLTKILVACSLLAGCALNESVPSPSTATQQIASEVANKVTGDSSAAAASATSAASASETLTASEVKACKDNGYVFSQKDIDALILNAFNEARGESNAGILAVLGVTMARVDSACYPDTVHDVVYQRKQFSWTWQRGTPRTLAAAKAIEPKTYAKVKALVENYIAQGAKPNGSLLYHAKSVNPSWSRSASIERTKVMGSHIFYDHRRC